MNLIIDIGNSFTKVAFFSNSELLEKLKFENSNLNEFAGFIDSLEPNLSVIVSSVKDNSAANYLRKKSFNTYIQLSHATPLPVLVDYDTPETLGIDRVAAVVGATSVFPDNDVLVVDFGTAITYDLLVNKTFIGGNISPGLETRFRSLHEFTGRLPKVSSKEQDIQIGKNTKDAIIAGVQNGIIYETTAYIDNWKKQHHTMKVIFTGGDAFFFEKFIKRNIFASPNLVLIGLNKILEYNL